MTNTPAKQNKSKVQIMSGIMDAPSVKQKFEAALKENSDTFIASIIDLYSGDSYLQGCEPKQVAMEALKAATLKLPINKSLGFSYIVPYKTKGQLTPQFQIGYKGYIQLAMRTGQYRIINSDVVYEGELKHVNKLTGEIDFSGERSSAKVVGYFAHIEMINGFSKTLYMGKDDVTRHATRYSKSYNTKNGPWQTEFDAMAKKTVVRNLLSHYGYLSIEMIGAMDKDIETDQQIRDQGRDEDKQELDFHDVEYVDGQPKSGEADKEESGDNENESSINQNPTTPSPEAEEPDF